jgi:NADPH-dependent curcumin reductase CurA
VGDDAKVDFLTKQLGFTAAFNYKTESYAAALKRLAPDGIDIYYDNVGGAALDAALSALRLHGRIGMCVPRGG